MKPLTEIQKVVILESLKNNKCLIVTLAHGEVTIWRYSSGKAVINTMYGLSPFYKSI